MDQFTGGSPTGEATWESDHAKKVGSGFNYTHIFSGGNGVIYGVKSDGTLTWIRHTGWETWAAPRFLVHTKWEFPQRLLTCSIYDWDDLFTAAFLSHSSLNSLGVL